MIRLIFVFIICTISCHWLVGQSEVEWSKDINSPVGMNGYTKMLGIVDGHYFLAHTRGKKQIIEKFDLRNNFVSEMELQYFGNNEDYGIIEIMKTPSDTFIYMHEYLQKHKEWVLHISRYKDQDFQDPEEIYFESYKDVSHKRMNNSFSGIKNNLREEGRLIMSSDSSYIALVTIIDKTEYKQKEVVSAVVFDNSMNVIWKESFDHSFGKQEFLLEDLILLNNGTIKFLGNVRTKLRTKGKVLSMREKNLPRYRYTLYNLDQYGIMEEDIYLDKNKSVVDAGLYQSRLDDETYYISGVYSDGEKANRIKGVFCGKSNADLELTQTTFHEMEEELWKNMTFDYDVNAAIELSDGKFAIIAENWFVTSSMANDNFNAWNRNSFNNFNTFNQRQYFFNSDDLLIPVFDANCNLVKLNIVFKQYRSSSSRLGSYFIAKQKENTFLVFNDVKSRHEKKKLDRKGKVFTDLIEINNQGDLISQETLKTDKEIRFHYGPHLSGIDGDLLMTGYSYNGRVMFGTMKL